MNHVSYSRHRSQKPPVLFKPKYLLISVHSRVHLEKRKCHSVLHTGSASFCRSLCSCKSIAPIVCSLYDVSGAWIVAWGARVKKKGTSRAKPIKAAQNKHANL